ncbi:hypothetical protein MNJPNG_30105 [Cupriavidus oxalaticus]
MACALRHGDHRGGTGRGIAVSHYRFRKGFVAQGLDLSRLPYRSPFFPYGPIFAFVLCLIVTLGQNYQAFTSGKID